MPGLFRFPTHNGKEKSLLALFILHALRDCPKSGYDLIKEINLTAGGAWVPSKGTIYPLLRQLHDEGLIEIFATGKRAKTLYSLTEQGRTTLATVREMGRKRHRSMIRYKNLIIAVFGESRCSVKGLLFEIRVLVETMTPGKETEVVAVLRECRERLQGMACT
jgi:DNA-binding PadR family transcriptional regulator